MSIITKKKILSALENSWLRKLADLKKIYLFSSRCSYLYYEKDISLKWTFMIDSFCSQILLRELHNDSSVVLAVRVTLFQLEILQANIQSCVLDVLFALNIQWLFFIQQYYLMSNIGNALIPNKYRPPFRFIVNFAKSVSREAIYYIVINIRK